MRSARTTNGGEAAPAGPAARRVRPLPLYAQVRSEISESILNGAWPRGTQIPGEQELAVHFGVSVGTVRRALGELVTEGFLARRPRLGTIVTDRSPHHSMRFLYHYYRLHREDGELVLSTARVLSAETGPAREAERERLQLVEDRRLVARIRRLRSVDGKPAMHERIVLPAHRFPDLPAPENLPNRMYVFFEERYGVRLVSARESLRADTAAAEDCELLGVRPGHPILEIDQVSYDTAHSVVEWRVCRTITDGYRYINEIR